MVILSNEHAVLYLYLLVERGNYGGQLEMFFGEVEEAVSW